MRPSVRPDPFCNTLVRTVADTVTAGPMGPFYAAGMKTSQSKSFAIAEQSVLHHP